MKKFAFVSLFLTTPYLVSAQSLSEFIPNLTTFINTILVPFLIGIGFLIFIINAVRYFVAGSGDEQGRENAKNLAIYAVLGFVLIVIFWGIVNMIANSIGLNQSSQPTPDFVDGSVQPGNRTTTTPPPQQLIDCPLPNGTTVQLNIDDCLAQQGFGQPVPFDPPGSGGSGTVQPGNPPNTWLGGLIQSFPRPFRNFFWWDWLFNNNGSNRGELIDCQFPNGAVDRLTFEDCLEAGGEPLQPTGTNTATTSGATNPPPTNSGGSGSGSSFTLVDCEVFDPNRGQFVIIQVTQTQCDDLNSSGNAVPGRPAPLPGGTAPLPGQPTPLPGMTPITP